MKKHKKKYIKFEKNIKNIYIRQKKGEESVTRAPPSPRPCTQKCAACSPPSPHARATKCRYAHHLSSAPRAHSTSPRICALLRVRTPSLLYTSCALFHVAHARSPPCGRTCSVVPRTPNTHLHRARMHAPPLHRCVQRAPPNTHCVVVPSCTHAPPPLPCALRVRPCSFKTAPATHSHFLRRAHASLHLHCARIPPFRCTVCTHSSPPPLSCARPFPTARAHTPC